MENTLYIITVRINQLGESYSEADTYADQIAELLTDEGYDVDSIDVEESLPSL